MLGLHTGYWVVFVCYFGTLNVVMFCVVLESLKISALCIFVFHVVKELVFGMVQQL